MLIVPVSAQNQSIEERLGYPKGTKLLIMHADDIGVSYSVNKATIEAFEKGGINSASIMVPCPWFKDIASFIQENPQYDFGLHLTLTSEWKNYKWDGVLPSSEIPTLLNEEGYMYESVQEVLENADLKEVEAEIRAQVQRAYDFGILPTHLDSHMGTLFSDPAYFEIYQKIGKEFNLPVFIPMNQVPPDSDLANIIDPYFIPVNSLYSASPQVDNDNWNEFYLQLLKDLKPGINEIIVHVGYDDDEMKAVCIDHPDWGSAWRQRDLNFVLSQDYKNALKTHNIELVTYREIKELMK